MDEVAVSMEGVTVCAPCDQGAQHPESHAGRTRLLLQSRAPADTPDETTAQALACIMRLNRKTTGPITIHKGPVASRDGETGKPLCEWAVTQP
ncbi:MAG TPA: hypothetical protein VGH27_24395 [Streptosporangiaceae bacterium]|jgi:hypothetical protein